MMGGGIPGMTPGMPPPVGGANAGEYEPGFPKRCDLCHVTLVDSQVYAAHFNGKRHQKELRKKESEAALAAGNSAATTGEMGSSMNDQQKWVGTNPVSGVRCCTLCCVD